VQRERALEEFGEAGVIVGGLNPQVRAGGEQRGDVVEAIARRIAAGVVHMNGEAHAPGR
jgi:hypothetical protein